MDLSTAGQITFLIVWLLSFVLLYWIVKMAVANGVREANRSIYESVKEIKTSIIKLDMQTKKESR